jgi:hypothetical protein
LKSPRTKRGRFRDFVKTALYHLVLNYQQARRRPRPLPLKEGAAEPAVEPPSLAESDAEFAARWREELLRRAWEALADFERSSGKPYHSVLRLQAEHSGQPSAELARQLAARLGRPCSADAFRQALHRARVRFAELLIAEVARSLQTDDDDQVEQELLDLGLFPYCRGVWARRQGG